MKLYSEKELFSQSEHVVFRLRNLYVKDNSLFHQFKDFISIPFFINDRISFNYKMFSSLFFKKGEEFENLFSKGPGYMAQIAEPNLLEITKNKVKAFHLRDDYQAICSSLQCIYIQGETMHIINNKCMLDHTLSMNTTLFPGDMSSVAKLINNLLPNAKNSLVYWQRFQSLTKQEKLILKMIAKGDTNAQIGEALFVSKHTVVSHRKNVYKKLEIKTIQELVRFALVMDLL